jgi:hypothetical protein
MLDGISNFEWKMMKNLVNCQQLLFTETKWHSKSICAKSVEKNTLEPL